MKDTELNVQVAEMRQLRLGLEPEECVVQHLVVNVHTSHLGLHPLTRPLLALLLLVLLSDCPANLCDTRLGNELCVMQRNARKPLEYKDIYINARRE